MEISINNKKDYVVSLYRSPSQTPDEFDSFSNNLEKLITDIYSRKADFVMMIGDFNAKSYNWSINDTTTPEGSQLDSIASLYGMKELISEPTHISQQSSSCIDLIFTNQPNIVMDSGVDSSLKLKCHHQIIYSKRNLIIEYPPPYIRKVWNYNRAETYLINHAIENCDWPILFLGKYVHQQVEVFNKALLNIFHNYIPNKFILCDDKDSPWINEEIKSLIHRKKSLYQRQRKSGSIDHTSLNALTLDILNAISSSKLKYHERLANKLNDPKTSSKTYWTIFKTFVNGSKIPLIPPLLVTNKLVTNFLDKANLFNNFFAKQCTPISNDNTIPAITNFETSERLSSLEFCADDIVKIIRSLGQNKDHGHDEISIRIIKLCASSISKPLHLIFRNCLEIEPFPKEWKKANIIPTHKKVINNQ